VAAANWAMDGESAAVAYVLEQLNKNI